MAKSPKDASGGGSTDIYELGWKAVNKLMMEGRSWSGREANCVFLNTGAKRFANVSAISGLNFLDDARGLAVCDWDQDGSLDLWLANRSAPQTRFLRNQGPRGHFLSLQLKGTTSNNDAMNRAVTSVAKKYISGQEITDGLLNHVEVAIRAYDPCLSCATHALGKMPLQIEIINAEGSVLSSRKK